MTCVGPVLQNESRYCARAGEAGGGIQAQMQPAGERVQGLISLSLSCCLLVPTHIHTYYPRTKLPSPSVMCSTVLSFISSLCVCVCVCVSGVCWAGEVEIEQEEPWTGRRPPTD